MSVINKMLRDLDSRQASGATPAQSQTAERGVMRGTASVQGRHPSTERSRITFLTLRWLAGLLVLAAAGAAAWYFNGTPTLKGRPAQVAAPSAVPALAPPVTTPVPAPTVRVQVAPSGSPEMSVSRAGAVAAPARLSLRSSPAAHLEGSTRSAGPDLARVPQERASAGQVAAPSAATTSAVAVPAPSVAAQRQAAAQETLAQAQGLWAAGSREAALELMRGAVAVAERAYSADTLPAGSPVLPSLVRELARMELAEGHGSQVLEMLTRLEPVLSNQADLWAVRGNVAQRLGRHQDSANAYLTALKLRPNEPRWMLGAAVSLAAQGKTAAAAELAERARAGGVVSPEVSAYLRQLGTPLRDH